MKSRRDEKISESSGQALVELVLVLTLLTLLTMGVVDFARVIQVKNIITDMSREGADLAARGGLTGTQATIDANIMNALAYTAQPLKMRDNGMMYISLVQGFSDTPPKNQIKIMSQDAWTGTTLTGSNKPASSIGVPSPNVITTLGSFSLGNGETAYVVEVFYKYPSIFSSNTAKITPVLYSKAIF